MDQTQVSNAKVKTKLKLFEFTQMSFAFVGLYHNNFIFTTIGSKISLQS